jgi:hypothetical protein
MQEERKNGGNGNGPEDGGPQGSDYGEPKFGTPGASEQRDQTAAPLGQPMGSPDESQGDVSESERPAASTRRQGAPRPRKSTARRKSGGAAKAKSAGKRSGARKAAKKGRAGAGAKKAAKGKKRPSTARGSARGKGRGSKKRR